MDDDQLRFRPVAAQNTAYYQSDFAYDIKMLLRGRPQRPNSERYFAVVANPAF